MQTSEIDKLEIRLAKLSAHAEALERKFQQATHPFTPEEKEVMDALVVAHNKFCSLQKSGLYHKHAYDWATHFHSLQDILIVGATMRQYPDYFNNELNQ